MSFIPQIRVKNFIFFIILITVSGSLFSQAESNSKPNFLVIFVDDLSWDHLSINGSKVVQTPNLDRLAREGMNFSNAFVSAPSCTPSRAALLTGRNGFELEQGASLWGYLPLKFQTYHDVLNQNGYKIGGSGKGMGPSVLINRSVDPAGKMQNSRSYAHYVNNQVVYRATDYPENMNVFLQANKNQPFCFWMGPIEPHRPYDRNLTNAIRGNPAELTLPAILPNDLNAKKDFNDYLAEVEMIDIFVGKAFKILEDNGLLDNTIIIFSSDNGMPFPRAKTHLYDTGTKVPLIVWKKGMQNAGQTHDGVVSLIDVAPTILDYAKIGIPDEFSGKSLHKVMEEKNKRVRKHVLLYKERHAWRKQEAVYPVRGIRTQKYLLLWNLKPDRKPIDTNSGPALNVITQQKDQYPDIYDLSFGSRPELELYDVRTDSLQLNNLLLTNTKKFKAKSMKRKLKRKLKKLNDPRVTDREEIFQYAPYLALIFKRGLLSYGSYLSNPSAYPKSRIIELLERAYELTGASEEFKKVKEQEGW